MTYWLTCDENIDRGLYLPCSFFLSDPGELCVGLAETKLGLRTVGGVRGLYLWDDQEGYQFQISSGSFGLMAVTAVTQDEDALAQETTPPHLLLFLKKFGVLQTCDPFRKSVMSETTAEKEWEKVARLSHDEVVSMLQARVRQE